MPAADLQLELEDVLLLCGRPTTAAATAVAGRTQQFGGAASISGGSGGAGTVNGAEGSSFGPGPNRLQPGTAAHAFVPPPSPARPEYLLFLALMAWLDHRPERQQYRQMLLDCVNFDRMTNYELSQVGLT